MFLVNAVCQLRPFCVQSGQHNTKKLTHEILIELVDHISVHFKYVDEFHRIAEFIEINITDTAEMGEAPPKHKIHLTVYFPNKTQSYYYRANGQYA